ncbi:MAG: O-antigen ligase family protein [Candidatus Aquicultorales bacterium]
MRAYTASISHKRRSNRDSLSWGLFLLCLLGMVSIIYVAVGDASIALAGLGLVALGILAFVRPKFGLGLVLLWTVFQYWLVSDFEVLPSWFVWLDEAFLALVTFSWVANKVVRREAPGKSDISVPLLLLAGIGLISTVWHQNSALAGLAGIRGVLQYSLVFYAIVNLKPTEREQKRMTSLMVLSAVVQVFVVLYQLATRGGGFGAASSQFSTPTGASPIGDLLPGTFGLGGANNLGYFLSLVILFLLGRAYYEKGRRWYLLPTAIALALPWFLASARASYWAFPVVLALILLLVPGEQPGLRRAVLLVAPLVALASSGVIRFISDTWNRIVETQTQPYSPRFLYYTEVYGILARNDSLLIGLGPGTLGSYTANVFGSYYDRLMRGLFDQGTTWNNTASDSQIVAIFAEFGVLGLIVAGWIVFVMIASARRLFSNPDPWSRTVAVGGLAAALMLVFASVTTNAWEVQPIAAWVWMLAGLVQLNKDRMEAS